MTNRALTTFEGDREKLIALACRLVESRAVAEELVQDSWLRWQERDYRVDDARPLFRCIVKNLARDWLRRQRTERSYLADQVLSPEDLRDPERIVVARQELAKIADALAKLPPRTITAFRMRRFDGLTYAQIAKRLGISTSRVHGHVVKALSHIALALMD